MPIVRFEESAQGPGTAADAPEGGRLVDVCDDARAPVAFSCRSATCATCRVAVIEGADLLDPPNADERELLDLLGAPRSHRLACQAVVRPGAGRLVLRWIEGG
jgi:ferredoxin